MAEATRWEPWVVCGEGFEVLGGDRPGHVSLFQVDETQFYVSGSFRFANPVVTERLVRHLAKVGAFDDDDARRAAVVEASGYSPSDGFTDLASIPPFMRWFVNSYGLHTLAAVIHDRLITDVPDGGVLRSDVVADRFFREMLHACGTSFMRRWTMWSAVALRTRFHAGSWKRIKLAMWALSSVAGIGGTVWLFATGRPVAAVLYGLALLFVASALWGRQWGAAVVAAVGLPFIAPAAALVLVASGAIRLIDLVAKRWDKPLPSG